MPKIVKKVEVVLTKEEIDSPDPIDIVLTIAEQGSDEKIDYTISYPKGE